MAGHFYNTVDFDPSSAIATKTSNGSKNMVVLKLDSNFNFVKTLGSSSADVVEEIELDDQDNIFCTGYYFGSMDFDTSNISTVNKSKGGSSDTYLLKLDKLTISMGYNIFRYQYRYRYQYSL